MRAQIEKSYEALHTAVVDAVMSAINEELKLCGVQVTGESRDRIEEMLHERLQLVLSVTSQ